MVIKMGGTSDISAKKPSMTPKTIINMRYGNKARYKVEEVRDYTQTMCPGLAISQNIPCLFRCTLELPETVVVSDNFKRKKDAEQSAAEKAIEKLGIFQKEYTPTVPEAWDDLASRLDFLFADEFVSSLHPLSGHFRAALMRDSNMNDCVPVSVIALYDGKISNTCKYIDPAAEFNSLLVLSLILTAAKKTKLVMSLDDQLSLKWRNTHSLKSSISSESMTCESKYFQVISIPGSSEKEVKSLKLKISANSYYLDVIGDELGVSASKVLISRPIGKASSELRIYSCAPAWSLCDNLLDRIVKGSNHLEGTLNERASYFCGHDVYGDAILASVGYTWKSSDLFHDDVSLRTYCRILVSKIPSGIYQISRQAVLVAKLPLAMTTKSNWRGSSPREILCTFCRLHHLSEPVFSIECKSLDSSPGVTGSCKKLKVLEEKKEDENGAVLPVELSSCEVKILSKNQELILCCSPQESYQKQIDAIQYGGLKVLSFFDVFFEKPDISLEELNLIASKLGIHLTPDRFFEEFKLCHTVLKCAAIITQACGDKNDRCGIDAFKDEPSYIDIHGQNSGIAPSNGSLACINFTVSLTTEEECRKELLESCENFEFEMGNEAVLPNVEAAIMQITVGQSACFQTGLLPCESILAAGVDSEAILSLLSSSKSCKLEYNITLLRVTEPMEERMEQAFFSPPLSKQRVEFAVQQIKESSAVSLVDYGCGSGSLLNSLLQYPTSLEKIVGVDISVRALTRAAKSLHTKLNNLSESKETSSCVIKSAVLYDGSITEFDSRLRGFDIATCLEVIEHMEEEQASEFGDVALGYFCPKILIISTPNYEYNTLLQGSTLRTQDDDPEDKNHLQSPKFRNHDHKFEWTRAQFNQWASNLATKHNYILEFSGVGGSADIEPGFASQIGIFTRDFDIDDSRITKDFPDPCATIWEWIKPNLPT